MPIVHFRIFAGNTKNMTRIEQAELNSEGKEPLQRIARTLRMSVFEAIRATDGLPPLL